MEPILVNNLNLGGIADSDYQGIPNSVAEMVGLDIHSEGGIIKLNQALVKDSGTTIDSFVKVTVPCSDGNTYLFSSTSGKIWKRDVSAVYTLEATAAPAAGSAGITGAWEYQGYIYYAMQNRLGRWAVGTAWSGRNDNWATFTNGDAEYHPMWEVNSVLYIGDRNFIAQVDAGVFSANALDIKSPYRITCLGQLKTDLVIGTTINSNVMRTELLRWNTWSVSWSTSDPIPEVGINAFLDIDNFVVVSAGTKGNLYSYDGDTLSPLKQIKGTWSSTNKAIVHPNARLNFNGMPLFGLSQVTGTGVNLGVYSIHRTGREYPMVLNLEFPISEGDLTGIEIGSICSISADQFMVTWKKGSTFGADVLSLTQKQASGYLITRVLMVDRTQISNYAAVKVPYRSLPSGTGIVTGRRINHGSMVNFTTGEHKNDDMRKQVETEVDIGEASTVQLRLTLNGSGNLSPEVELLSTQVS